MKNSKIRAIVILFFSVFLAAVAGRDFLRMRQPEPIYPGQGISEKKMLSDYFSPLRGTNGDTEVYFFEGENPGATVLILGGTHPNEPAGFITAIHRASASSGRQTNCNSKSKQQRLFAQRSPGSKSAAFFYSHTSRNALVPFWFAKYQSH